MHRSPDSIRFSQDLDYFNDREALVATAFAADRNLLEAEGYELQMELSQPGYIRVIASRGGEQTKIEWAFESAFRFMPPLADPEVGYVLHPIDLAINKVHALAGRDEPRDFLDVVHAHSTLLSLGALCWAAVGKDPGYSPPGLLEQLARKGRFRPADFEGLQLNTPPDLISLKKEWGAALQEAVQLVERLPGDHAGCVYVEELTGRIAEPTRDLAGLKPHFGSLGGTLPKVL